MYIFFFVSSSLIEFVERWYSNPLSVRLSFFSSSKPASLRLRAALWSNNWSDKVCQLLGKKISMFFPYRFDIPIKNPELRLKSTSSIFIDVVFLYFSLWIAQNQNHDYDNFTSFTKKLVHDISCPKIIH